MSTQSMATRLPGDLVDVTWLQAHLQAKDLVVLDCSWHQPHMKRNAHAEYLQRHIAGARFFDFDQRIAEPASSLPHMLPPASLFESEIRTLGISNDSSIIFYDATGIQTAARGWWMFQCFGHDKVAVLDGGLPAWLAANGALESGEPAPASPGAFRAQPERRWVKDLQTVRRGLDDANVAVLDARSAGRFEGTEPEPREGMRSGHMPGAISLPFTQLLDNGRFRSPEVIAAMLEQHGLATDQELVFSCGSGVTACILALGAKLAGYPNLAVYDGSWSEWGGRDDTPVVTGK